MARAYEFITAHGLPPLRRTARLAAALPAPSRHCGVAASPGEPGGASATLTRAATRGFRSDERGAATIGAALSIAVLVTMFATLMGFVHRIYIEDRMERGARAGARAVSLLAAAPASRSALERIVCDAVRRELWPGLAEGEKDECTERWTVEITAFATPRALGDDDARGTEGSPGGENEDMVLVRLTRPPPGLAARRARRPGRRGACLLQSQRVRPARRPTRAGDERGAVAAGDRRGSDREKRARSAGRAVSAPSLRETLEAAPSPRRGRAGAAARVRASPATRGRRRGSSSRSGPSSCSASR